MNIILKAYTLSECMDAMASFVHGETEYGRLGERNLIFCEDRLTLLAEKALIAKTGGTFESTVTTFARFLKTDTRAISKQGSVMAVGEVMARLQREGVLQCFTTAAGIGNNAKCIYETLAQMSASEITPEVLRESLALLPDDMLKKKIADLAAIYEGYTAFLQENRFLDESRYLSLLPAYIKNDKSLRNANIIFLGFSSFTAQAAQAIRAAISTAKNVVGIFCGGEEEIYTNRAATTFKRVCEETEKPLIKDCGVPLSGVAEDLRRGLFNPEKSGKDKVETDDIHIFEGEDKIAEAEYVATQIKRAMQEKTGLRYRDFAVLTSSVGGYSLPLKKAFSEYGIPYFIDEKRSLKRHPLSRFLLDAFRVVKERYSSSSVQSLTQNFFFGESDEYRNYLLKFANYRGGAKRAVKTGETVEKQFDIAKLEDGRQRVLKATENIKARGQGRDYCNAVRKILTDFAVDEGLKKLEDSLQDISQKGYLSQIGNALDALLAEAELLTGDKELTASEFEAVLQDGLDATELSLIPLKADAVFVGDIADSRISRAEIVFALGMTEEVPRAATDTAIVSDKEIARLAEVKTLLEPTVAEVNLRSRESVCLNLCAFMDELHLTYPLAADGSEPSLSEIFRYTDNIFCRVGGGKLPRLKKLLPNDFAYKCSAVAPAIRQLLIEKREYELCKEDTRKEYSSLFAALDKLSVQEKDDYLKESKGQVCVERGEELFFRDGKISPTSLEGYFSCPFRHFAERGLKLKEREETAVLAVDTGNFIHELLERTSKRYEEIETEAELRRYAIEVGRELLTRSVYAMQQDTASGLVFSEKLLEEGAQVAVAAYRQIKQSDFKVEATEKTVETDWISGKVDRIDGTEKFVRVVDFKTGTIDDSAASYYTGRKMQMQLYMSKVQGARTPAGVFYFPAAVSYTDDEEGKFRMKGFMNGEPDALLCGDKNLTENKKSEFFPAALKNGGNVKRVMDEQTFRDFIDYSTHVARQGCKELKEGYIEPTPYEKSCEYCKYGGMCGFDKDVSKERAESTIDPATIAEIARKQREGE